ncbi:MAG TPA: glycerate dehydrogenase [Candidatus Bathyarchaeota archaeon]|nr:glycerate dehydrogenase [Candidatus Bathyarchaeota archaeon]
MKIVVVDHVYLEKEYIEKLRSIGDVEIFKDMPKNSEELKRRIGDADIAIVGWSHLTEEILKTVEKLKMVSIWATTCHYVDLKTARERKIVVTHVPGYATEAVAEHVFALLLAAARKLLLADKHVRRGEFDWRPFRGLELAGRTIGVIGTGAIGCRVAEIAKAFKMRILAFDKYPNFERAEEIGMKYVDLQTLLRESDVITLHVPLTPETEGLIGKSDIDLMKEGCVLINTSQGKVIDEKALIEALKSRKIAYAGLDVFEEEPPPKDNPLFKLENTVLSPHIGFHTLEAAKRCTEICIDNIVKFIEGQPQNLCQL